MGLHVLRGLSCTTARPRAWLHCRHGMCSLLREALCSVPAASPPGIPANNPRALQRMMGRPVRFVTGTDEHGEKIAAAAAARGMEPQAHCDDIVGSFKELWSKVG